MEEEADGYGEPNIGTRDLELLFEKCASLTFELLAFYEDAEGVREQSSGSGMFVAPCQALTARHVANDLHNVNAGWTDELRRRTGPAYFVLPYHVQARQIADFHKPRTTAIWGLTRVWVDALTDIASLEVAPGNEDAHLMLGRMRPMFPVWSLLPPAVGATVVLIGQHRDKPASPDIVSDASTYRCLPGVVTKNFEQYHDLGMHSFPGYLVNIEVPHGMSGGPVFCEGRLCGIISGGLGSSTYVAALWPLCLTVFESSPNLGELNRNVTYEELFETGQSRWRTGIS